MIPRNVFFTTFVVKTHLFPKLLPTACFREGLLGSFGHKGILLFISDGKGIAVGSGAFCLATVAFVGHFNLFFVEMTMLGDDLDRIANFKHPLKIIKLIKTASHRIISSTQHTHIYIK